MRELERNYRAVVEEILELRGADERIRGFLRSISTPGELADTSGYSPDLRFEQKRELLDTLDVTERLDARARASSASGSPSCRCAAASATTSTEGAEKQQREYFLRKQMESIRKELGEDEGSVDRRVPDEDRRGRDARRGPRAGRARARRGSSAPASRAASRR